MANGDGTKTNPKTLARLRSLPVDHPVRVKARARSKKWNKANKARHRAWKKKRAQRLRATDPARLRRESRVRTLKRYGLTPESWEALFDGQDRRCAICGTADCGDDRWHTDHDEKLGRTAVRGILCVRCNIGLGQFMHDPDRLARAISYLNRASTETCQVTDHIKTTEEIREEQSAPRQIGDMKHGLGGSRPEMSLMPRTGMIYGTRAISYGAAKYARGNYHGPPPAKLGDDAGAKRLLGYIDATMRHLTHVSDAINRALGTGGDVEAACGVIDAEASAGFPASNLPHLSHALASLLIGVSCAVDDGLLPEDPGQPWRASLAAMTGGGTGEVSISQKDDPAAERERVRVLRAESDAARRATLENIVATAPLSAARAARQELVAMGPDPELEAPELEPKETP